MTAEIKSHLMHIILFDIDGTLLHSGGAGQGGIERALELAFGVTAPTEGISTAGRTDRGIGQDLIRFHGLEETAASHERLMEAYLRVLPSEITRRNGVVYPGVRELLSRLSSRNDVRLGLLTGNYREAAWLKLRHYGLAGHFAFGGFGDEHADRDDVARQALAAAIEHHAPQAIDHDKLWVVGDTPADVRCGRAIGARVIAVATGVFSSEELAESRPDHLFADFTDVEAVLSLWPPL
jgi:phosphoglycolate phosphatase-like HAD superfamily hydrolase